MNYGRECCYLYVTTAEVAKRLMTVEFAGPLVNVTRTDPLQPCNHRPRGRKRTHDSRSRGETQGSSIRVVN